MATLSDAGIALSSASQQDITQRKLEMDALRTRLGDGKNRETKLRESCEGFESVFLQKMWEQMRNNVNKEGYLHSKDEEMYQSMFDVELAKKMASAGGIGLADMLYEQLSAETSNAGRSTVPVASMAPGILMGSGAATSGPHTTQAILAQAQAMPATGQKPEAGLSASYLYTDQPTNTQPTGQPAQDTAASTMYHVANNTTDSNEHKVAQNHPIPPEDNILAALHDLRIATATGMPPQEKKEASSAQPSGFEVARAGMNPFVTSQAQPTEFALPPSMAGFRQDIHPATPLSQAMDTRSLNEQTHNTRPPGKRGIHSTSWNLPDNGPISAQPKPLPLRNNRATGQKTDYMHDSELSGQANPAALPGFQPSIQPKTKPSGAQPNSLPHALTSVSQPAGRQEPATKVPEMVSLGSTPFASSPEGTMARSSALPKANQPDTYTKPAPVNTSNQTLSQSPFALDLNEAEFSGYGFRREG